MTTIMCSLQIDWTIVAMVMIIMMNDHIVERDWFNTEHTLVRPRTIEGEEDLTMAEFRHEAAPSGGS